MELTVVKNDFSEIIQPDPQKGDMKEELPTRVCFICTGNICRSPMAAAALNKYGKGKYRAVSAGLAICDGDKDIPKCGFGAERSGDRKHE